MKVQTKIILLLVMMIATFAAGIYAISRFERAKFQQIARDRAFNQTKAFNKFLDRIGDRLYIVALDNTELDAMVEAIERRDVAWADKEFDRDLKNPPGISEINAIWIYAPDGTLFFSKSNRFTDELQEVPIPKEAFSRLFTGPPYLPLQHFYVKIPPNNLLEVRAATVHPSRDTARQTEPQGYLFAGRVWSNANIKEMSLFSNNDIRIVAADQITPQIEADERNGLVTFSRVLNGWDGKPVARLAVQNESPIFEELNNFRRLRVIWLVIFALVLVGSVSVALVEWVRRPLRLISRSLATEDLSPLKALQNDKTEFGKLGQLIHKFFEQRSRLVQEMHERRATEEALRQSEEQLRHSQKMEAIGRLAGGVAHDFNNLLTAIIGYSEILTTRLKNDPVARQNAELILKAGEQAASLTRQLLAFSRKQMLQPRVIDLNALIGEIEKLLQRVIGEHIELHTAPEAPIGRVRADPSQIEQVIINLGVNARDAMPRGGKLTIRTANVTLNEMSTRLAADLPEGRYVMLAVSDTGSGMDRETKSRIFEPFFTTKGPGQGTGLGLATVYGIVKQSGGGISVESAPGRGSTFRIYLPLEEEPVEVPVDLPAPMHPSENAETVLVVEDEEIVRELVCEVLSDQGYTVLCASRGLEALELARDHDGPIELLITDVVMPEMSGQELVRSLAPHRPDMKVLYVSGYSDNDISDQGVLDAGVEFLEKPFTPNVLARKVRTVLDDVRNKISALQGKEFEEPAAPRRS